MSSLPPLIDSHCHLEFDYETKSSDELIQEAHAENVQKLITIGTEFPTLNKVQEISVKNENVYHTIGIHPHDAKTFTNENNIQVLEKLAQHEKCVAIGEIGLDYHYDNSPREEQKKRLKEQLELAQSMKLPVVIHARDAEDDLKKMLGEYAKSLPANHKPGAIHCFSGTQKFGQACLDMGFYISFSGILTFKKAEDLRESAKAFPIEKLLVETDSPFLAPIPYRGKQCEPRMVRETANKLAELKEISIEEVSKHTVANTKELFGIS